jgi:hypothetical protein
VRRVAGHAWTRATALADTRRGAAILVGAALVVFAIQSVGWPEGPGRDLESYLAVYVDFWHTNAVFPWEMLNRTPVAPLLVGGILDLGQPWLVELFGAVLFAGSVLLYARTALLFGRGPAVLVGAALVLYPGYGIVFHELATEIVFAAGFAVWTAVIVRAALRPSAWWFASAGLATALIALTRPANQVFLVAVILPLALTAPWRVRIGRAAAFVGVGVVLLVGWAATNAWRYDDFAVSRGTQANLPFFRAFIVDHIVEPDNGPASRELAAAVQRDLLPREPYRSYGIDLATFFSRGSPREQEDLISLSDRLYGWHSDYSILGRAAREAVLAHPGTFSWAVFQDFVKELWKPLFAGRQAPVAEAAAPAGGSTTPAPPPTVVVDGAARPDGRRADSLREPERPDLHARPFDPRGVDVRDGAPRRVRRSCDARTLGGERPLGRAAVRRLPPPLVEPVARSPDGPLVEALPAAAALAPGRDRRCRVATAVALVGDRRAGRRRARDAARDRRGRLGGARLRGAGRTGVRALRRGGPPRRPDETGRRPDERGEHAEQQRIPEQQVAGLEGAALVHVVAVEVREPRLRRDERDREEGARDTAAAACDERDERDEPEHELR